uniref:Uncharacterized protein n=1 Tax=Anguilla anguilla TaxID=7936 RepID=A0A0E9VW53_ANGAN
MIGVYVPSVYAQAQGSLHGFPGS